MEQNLFEFEIISIEAAEKVMVEWVEIFSPTGNFTVGPDHSPLVSIVKRKSSVIYQTHDKQIHTIATGDGGFFQTTGDKAMLLLG